MEPHLFLLVGDLFANRQTSRLDCRWALGINSLGFSQKSNRCKLFHELIMMFN